MGGGDLAADARAAMVYGGGLGLAPDLRARESGSPGPAGPGIRNIREAQGIQEIAG